MAYAVGQILDGTHLVDGNPTVWREVLVKQVDVDRCFCHFIGLGDEWDEWLPLSALAAKGTQARSTPIPDLARVASAALSPSTAVRSRMHSQFVTSRSRGRAGNFPVREQEASSPFATPRKVGVAAEIVPPPAKPEATLVAYAADGATASWTNASPHNAQPVAYSPPLEHSYGVDASAYGGVHGGGGAFGYPAATPPRLPSAARSRAAQTPIGMSPGGLAMQPFDGFEFARDGEPLAVDEAAFRVAQQATRRHVPSFAAFRFWKQRRRILRGDNRAKRNYKFTPCVSCLAIALHVGAFAIAWALGGFALAPLDQNPLMGPPWAALRRMGGKDALCAAPRHGGALWGWYRAISAMWLNAGALSLGFNTIALVFVGCDLERGFGHLRIALLYVFAGVFTTVVSMLVVPRDPGVGATAAVLALCGADVVDTCRYRLRHPRQPKCKRWRLKHSIGLATIILVSLLASFLPFTDLFSNLAGLALGATLGYVLFPTRLSENLGSAPMDDEQRLAHEAEAAEDRLAAQEEKALVAAAAATALAAREAAGGREAEAEGSDGTDDREEGSAVAMAVDGPIITGAGYGVAPTDERSAAQSALASKAWSHVRRCTRFGVAMLVAAFGTVLCVATVALQGFQWCPYCSTIIACHASAPWICLRLEMCDGVESS